MEVKTTVAPIVDRQVGAKGTVSLKPFPGDLTLTPGGWRYERDGRCYLFHGESPHNRHLFDVAASISDRPYWRRIDVTIATCREDFAREIASGDLPPEREIRRDLNLGRFGMQLEAARCDIVAALAEERHLGTGAPDEIVITGLVGCRAMAVVKAAIAAGARVFERRFDAR